MTEDQNLLAAELADLRAIHKLIGRVIARRDQGMKAENPSSHRTTVWQAILDCLAENEEMLYGEIARRVSLRLGSRTKERTVASFISKARRDSKKREQLPPGLRQPRWRTH